MVDYDTLQQQFTVDLMGAELFATNDSAFSILDIEAYTSADSTDTLFTYSKAFWSATIAIHLGRVYILGGLTPGDVSVSTLPESTHVSLSNFVRTIQFTGTPEEFDNMQVLLRGDTGYGTIPTKYALTTTGAPLPAAPPVLRVDVQPNPVAHAGEFYVTLPSPSPVQLTLFRADGSVVRHIARESLPQGIHRIPWVAEGDDHVVLPSGFYFYRLGTNSGARSGKVLVVH